MPCSRCYKLLSIETPPESAMPSSHKSCLTLKSRLEQDLTERKATANINFRSENTPSLRRGTLQQGYVAGVALMLLFW